MAILIDEETKVVVQGITGREGDFHTGLMLQYGTKIMAGVTPGKGGLKVHGVPVYDSIDEALEVNPEINASIIFVPARFASDAVYEAIESNLSPIVLITEHIPILDSIRFINYARLKGLKIVGPNCPGVISPGRCKLGVMPSRVFKRGEVGVVSRSGTLTYEIADSITKAGLGQSTCIGIGGDPVTGLDFIEVVNMFLEDEETKAIVIIGEIGGDMEERLASYLKRHGIEKPMAAYIAGKTAPPGKRMGHAGAIISMGLGGAESKVNALRDAGVEVAQIPSQIPRLLEKQIEK